MAPTHKLYKHNMKIHKPILMHTCMCYRILFHHCIRIDSLILYVLNGFWETKCDIWCHFKRNWIGFSIRIFIRAIWIELFFPHQVGSICYIFFIPSPSLTIIRFIWSGNKQTNRQKRRIRRVSKRLTNELHFAHTQTHMHAPTQTI